MDEKKKIKKPPKEKEKENTTVEIDDDDSDQDRAGGDISDVLESFKSQFGGQRYQVRIEKFNDTKQLYEWVKRLPFDTFDPFTSIQNIYGPGDYVATLLDEKGRYVGGGRMSFSFAAPLESSEKKDASQTDPLKSPVLELLLSQQRESNERMMQLILAFAPKGGESNSMVQMIEALKSLNSLAPKDTGTKSIQEALALMGQIRTALGDNAGASDARGGGWLEDLKEAIKFLPMLKAGPEIPPAGGAAPARRPSATIPGQRIMPATRRPIEIVRPAAAAPANGNTDVIQGEERHDMKINAVEKILFYVPKFAAAAAAGEDVEKWADYLLTVVDTEIVPALVDQFAKVPFVDLTEDKAYAQLISSANDPMTRDKIFKYAPALENYREWTYNVIDRALQILKDEITTAQDEANAAPATIVTAPPTTDGNK